MTDRSNRADVRNPLLALPEMHQLREVIDRYPDVRDAHLALLKALQRDTRNRGQESWDRHKPPMAAYWKGWSVYFGHLARALRKPVAPGIDRIAA